jgi:TP901 family phage tail tape measure protein
MPEQVQVTFIGIDQASDAARNVAKSLGELGSTAGGIASGGLSTLGGIAGGIVGKLAEIGVKAAETAGKLAIGFGASSLSAFKDFSQSISEIGAVTGATSDEMKKMEDKALELGAKFPVSAKDAADAMVELGKAGLNADQVISASTGTVQLASATHYNMADSATILASAINQFGLKAEDANRVTDLLAQTANASAVDVKDLSETFKYAGPVAQAAGFSIEDVAKAAANLGNAGIKGSSAGTGLKAVLSQLASPGEKASAAFDKLGYSVKDSAGHIKPLQDQLVELRGKFDKINDPSAKIDLAKMIVGENHYNKFLALMDTTPDKFKQVSDSIDNAAGSGKRMADAMNDNLAGSVENMRGSIETLQIKVGKALAPAFRIGADAVANLANKLGPLADKMAGPITKAVQAVVGALSDFTLGLTGPMKLIQGEQLDGPFVKFGLALRNDVIPAIQGFIREIGPIAKTLFDVYEAINPLKTAFDVLQGFLTGGITGAFDAFGQHVSKIGDVFNDLGPKILLALSDIINSILDWIAKNGPSILDGFGKWVVSFVEWVAPVAGQLLGKLAGLITELLNWIALHASDILDKLADWAKSFIEWVGPLIPPLLLALANVALEIGKWIVNAIPDLVAQLGKWGEEFVNWIGPKIPGMITKLGDLATDLLKWLGEQIPKLVENLAKWGKEFVLWVIDAAPKVVDELLGLLGKITGFIIDHAGDIVAKLAEWAGAFLGFVGKDVLPTLPDKLGEIISKILGWIADQVGKIGDKLLNEWVPKFLLWVFDVVKELPGKLKEIIQAVLDWIGRKVDELGDKIKEWIPKFLDWIKDVVRDLPGKLKEIGEKILSFIGDAAKLVAEEAPKIGKAIVDGILKGIGDNLNPLNALVGDKMPNELIKKAKDGLGSHSPSTAFMEIGSDIVAGLALGINNNKDTANTAISSLVDAVISTGKNKDGGLYNVGSNLAGSMASGLYAGKSAVINAAISVAVAAIGAAMGALGVHSPSKVFMDIGKQTMVGLAEGIESNSNLAPKALLGSINQLVPAGEMAASQFMQSTNHYDQRTIISVDANYQNQPRESLLEDLKLLQMLGSRT